MRLRIGMSLLMPALLLAILGPMLLIDAHYSDLLNRKTPPFLDWAHPLGTDLLGRDTLARLAHSLRLTLITGILSLLIAQIIGGLLGLAILAKQPQFASIIVKTISQIMVLLWVVTMAILLYVIILDGTNTLFGRLRLIGFVVLFGAAISLLILRKKESLRPEVPERTRWTGIGWRILRLFLALPVLVPIMIFSMNLMQGTRDFIPDTLIIGLSIGAAIAPFTLRTTLTAEQIDRVPQIVGPGLFSALAWAILACSYLGFTGLGQSSFNADLGRLMMNDPPDPVVPLAALTILIVTISGLVLTGDGIRMAASKRNV